MSATTKFHKLTAFEAAQTLFFEVSDAIKEETYWRTAHEKWSGHIENATCSGRQNVIPAMRRYMSQCSKRANWWKAVIYECEIRANNTGCS